MKMLIYLSVLFIIIFEHCSINALKCRSCEFRWKFDQSFRVDRTIFDHCPIYEEKIFSCKTFIDIDFALKSIYFWSNALEETSFQQLLTNLQIPSIYNEEEKSIRKYQIDVEYSPLKVSRRFFFELMKNRFFSLF